jgi:hypothetical protein
MTKKLTLSLDADLVDFAHELAVQTKKPVSAIVQKHLLSLKSRRQKENAARLERARALCGIFKDIYAPDKKEIRRMFHEKNCR